MLYTNQIWPIHTEDLDYTRSQIDEWIRRLRKITEFDPKTDFACGCTVFGLIESIEDSDIRQRCLDAIGGGLSTKGAKY